MRYYSIVLFLFLQLSIQSVHAQPDVADFKTVFRVQMHATDTPPKLDGVLDDKAWQEAEVGGDFWQKVPYFAPKADPKTEIMLSYDDKNLYVAAKCWQSDDIIIQSLKRDEYWDNDGIAIVLDPLNTRTNAYLFGITAAGAQWDALRSTDDTNTDWSNKWYGEVTVTEEYWAMEMAIPLKIIRYEGDISEWGMNFVRNHINENEYHNWTAVPESFWPPDPAFAGNLVWDTPPPPQKGNYNIIPFVTSGISKNRGTDTDYNIDAGLDARVALSPTLNLDLTLNPDFSQIEVDELVTNLTRFSIFLPEKRTFFLENADLFADYGYSAVRPFFSRTVGLDVNRQAVPILYGARLTGNVTKSTRIGAMNIHSLNGENTLGQNQSAFSVQQQFGRSFVKGLFLNRQAYDNADLVADNYGRNMSIEGVYVSNNGQISAWASAHKSFKPEVNEKTGFYTSGFAFLNPAWEIEYGNAYVEENYYADLGFVARLENYDAARDTVIRLGYNENVASITYRIRPREGFIVRHNLGTVHQVIFNPDFSLNERSSNLSYSMALRSTADFSFRVTNNAVALQFPFSFVNGGSPLPADQYDFSFLSASYSSDERKMISYNIDARTGGFYNGSLHQANGSVNFRAQPWGNLSFGYQWNRLEFPEAYGKSTITALLSKLEIGFNRNLLWTTLFQYLDQSEYLGINSRLQWRFAPMSDMFLVYVDNYDVLNGISDPSNIASNNRALILKVNYWY